MKLKNGTYRFPLLVLLWTMVLCSGQIASAQIINTVAGTSASGFAGDGGTATNANLFFIYDVAIDASGNMYIVDNNNNRIRKVTPSGIITTIAGNGSMGYSGDGGAATAAKLNSPSGVAVDGAGNVYIADANNAVVRKVNTSGIISTFAGTGVGGFNGEGGQATAARFRVPRDVAVDNRGNVYIADYYNFRIRRVNAAGIVRTVAGTSTGGYAGDGGQATAAKMRNPTSVDYDSKRRRLYIADYFNNCIRMVDSTGIITTVAGTDSAGYAGNGGPATAALFDAPVNVTVDTAGDLYISDHNNFEVRKVDMTTRIISCVAGNHTTGYSGDGGLATAAQLGVAGICFDALNNLYMCSYSNIRKVDARLSVIGGPSIFCQGTGITHTNSFTGGTWSSSAPGVAYTAGGSGIVYGLSGGTATITYRPPGVYATYAITSDTVKPLPIVGPISGSPIICVGATASLSNSTPGGTWSSVDTNIAKIDTSGYLTGFISDSVTILYSVGNDCGTTSTTKVIYIDSPVTPVVTISTPHDSLLYYGQLITFTAEPTYGGFTPSYQWFLNEVPVPGVTANTYTVETYWHESVYCILTSSLGCVTKQADTSGSVFIRTNTVGVGSAEKSPKLSLYPNPNNGNFELMGEAANVPDCTIEYQIYDLKGTALKKQMGTLINDRFREKFSLGNNLPQGQYLMGIQVGNRKEILPFTIVSGH